MGNRDDEYDFLFKGERRVRCQRLREPAGLKVSRRWLAR